MKHPYEAYVDHIADCVREAGSVSMNLEPWEKNDIVNVLRSSQPAALLMPHVEDWNARHISTHHLVMDALAGCCHCRITSRRYSMEIIIHADAASVSRSAAKGVVRVIREKPMGLRQQAGVAEKLYCLRRACPVVWGA